MTVIRTKEYGDVDLDTASRDLLLDIRVGLEADLQDINFQLEESKQRYLLTGERYAPDWLRRARNARRAVLNRIRSVNLALKRIPKEPPPLSRKAQDVGNWFIDIAREALPPEVFQEILDAAIAQWQSQQEDR